MRCWCLAVILWAHALPAAPARPSILLISIDTLRADELGIYGYPRPTDAALARRTGDFVIYENAYTSIPLTLPAHVSLMSGRHPLELGLYNNQQSLAGPGQRPPLLAEILGAAGYRTAAVVASPVLAAATGLNQGFQVYREPVEGQGPPRWSADTVNAAAAAEMENPRGPFFLFVHYYDVHEPFQFPDRYGCWLRPDAALKRVMARRGIDEVAYHEVLNRDQEGPAMVDGREATLAEMIARYDASVCYATDRVADLLDIWDTTVHGPGSLVVILSDHGEGLGQHGFWSHGMNLYDESLRVPLLIRWPAAMAGGRLTVPVSMVDVAPTVLKTAGMDPGGMTGIPLVGVRSPAEMEREMLLAQRMRYVTPVRLPGLRNWRRGDGYAVLHGRFKYIAEEGKPPALFDRSRDPLEQNNLHRQRQLTEQRMEQALERWRDRALQIPWPPQRPGDRRLQHLRSLGYVDR